MLIRIPFSGFYYSIHDQLQEMELESILYGNTEIINHFRFNSYRDYMRDYCKYFVKLFCNETGLKLEFDNVNSPKYYNFETDNIYCQITKKELARIYKATDKNILAKKAKELFQSRDGFISFYPYHINEWPKSFYTWDCNHLYCLLLAYLESNELEFDEYEMMINEINHSTDWLYTLLDHHSNLPRLSNIAYYLEKRANR